MIDLQLDVPKDFYKEEYKCGFYITSEIKQLWAVELDLLYQLQIVCEKNNLRYFALGGTLLGAIRHNGFIPWDNDIDIIMPRHDYDKLKSITFPEPYFLSYTLTEKSFWGRHYRLRNSLTSGYTKSEIMMKNNKGIFIDIMPLDVVPASLSERDFHRKLIKRVTKWADRKDGSYRRLGYQKKIGLLLKYFLSSIVMHSNNYDLIFRNFEDILRKYEGEDTGFCGHASISYRERGVWQVELYENSLLVDFEFMKIRVPNEYDKVLSKYFGDNYMDIPDLNNLPKTDHDELFFDVNKPFTENFKWEKRKYQEKTI